MEKTQADPTLPDWWQREKQRRQNWILLFLVALLLLIAYFYWVSSRGRIGTVQGIDFDSRSYVAFIHQEKDGNTTFYAVRADGSDLRRLTPPDDKSNKQDPAWTSDGKSLLYSSNRSDSKVMQIYVLGQGDPRQLTYGTGNKFQPAASSDGKHILFLTQGAVKTVLLNGNDVDQLLPQPQAGNAPGDGEAPSSVEPKGPFLKAAFAPDGVAIAAVQAMSAEDTPASGGEISATDQVVRVLHPNLKGTMPIDFGKEAYLSWEPNGNRLATSFVERDILNDKGQPILVNGKPTVASGIRLWDFSGTDGKPKGNLMISMLGGTIEPKNIAWSPDGQLIAFEVWEAPDETTRTLRGIAVSSLTQTGTIQTKEDAKTVLTHLMLRADAKGIPANPRWSPDGARLLYEMRRPDGGHDLWVINSDGTNALNLTEKLGGDNSQSVWAPMKK